MDRFFGGQMVTSKGPPCHRFQVPWLESVSIAVSNNIDEEELARLAQEVGELEEGVGLGVPKT